VPLAEAERILGRNQQLANAGAISREELATRATAVVTAEAVRVAQAEISSAVSAVAPLACNNSKPNRTNTGSRSRWGIVAEKTLRSEMLLLGRNNYFRLSVEDCWNLRHRFLQLNHRCKLGHRRKLPPILIPAFACGGE